MHPRPWRPFGRDEIELLFADTRRADPFGLGLHTFAACALCIGAGFPTTYPEWSGLTLLVFWAVRMISHHRTLGPLFWEPSIWLLAAWSAWLAMSALWSPGSRSEIVGDFATLHWAAVPFALYPVLHRRRWLIAALIVGVLCGNFSQMGHAVGQHFGLPWLVWPRLADRNSGWWDPVVGGSILVAALGMHIAGAALGRSLRERGLGLAGCLITGVAILATGTRGAWIAGVLLVGLGAVVGIWNIWRIWVRRTDRGGTAIGGTVAIAAIAVLAVAAAGWWFVGESVSRRFAEATKEITSVLRDRNYSTFTGARLAMWEQAWGEFVAHPIRGVGAGGYQVAAARGGGAAPGAPIHAHAHSWPLHTLAITGLVGFALVAALVGWSIASGLRRDLRWNLSTSPSPAQLWERGYDAAPAFALIGLCLAGLFDPISINSQTACVWMILTALCVRCRPHTHVGLFAR